MLRPDILTTSTYLRNDLPIKPDRQYDPWGILLGLSARNDNFITWDKRLSKVAPFWENSKTQSEQNSKLKSIFIRASQLPFPYVGIHPAIINDLADNTIAPDSDFWVARFFPHVKNSKTRIVSTEPNIDMSRINPQLNLLRNLVPNGSISAIFLTRGKNSLWGRFPVINKFSIDEHQMSIPVHSSMTGFNMLLLTTEATNTAPKEWDSPFPKDYEQSGAPENRKVWEALHEAAHCFTISTCWEYIDRTYSLITPEQLLDLTLLRLNLLHEWFMQYFSRDFKPDSTSYLYEVKILQRAAWVAKNRLLTGESTEFDGKLPWIRGFHLDEISSQIGIPRTLLTQALNAMDRYLTETKGGRSSDPILNSALFSTDIGTHPVEEIVVNMIALDLIDHLSSENSNWKVYTGRLKELWRKWQEL